MNKNVRRPIAARIDWLVLFLYFVLVLIGVAAVYSVEYTSFDQPFFDLSKSHMRQLIWFGISLITGIIILLTDSKFFYSVAFLLYFIGILLLLATFVIGSDVKGSHSFIKFGSISFQPGELCKVFTALALARFIASPETNFKLLKNRLIGAAIALIPFVLILLENETGLALVYFAFFIAMYREGLPNFILAGGFLIAGLLVSSLLIKPLPLFLVITAVAAVFVYFGRRNIRKSPLFLILVIAAWGGAVLFSEVIVPFSFRHVFHTYQVERIYSMLGQEVPEDFLHPGEKLQGISDYNVRQSKIAIGSGGLWGKGFMHGTQTKYSFVPEQNTDFVFCGIGEQFGFVGSTLLVIIYAILLLRIVYIAERQRSTFSRVYAYCVAAVLFFHLAINLSMTMGLAPVIGITLPMLSYGGTSLLAFSVMLFILLRLDADRQMLIR